MTEDNNFVLFLRTWSIQKVNPLKGLTSDNREAVTGKILRLLGRGTRDFQLTIESILSHKQKCNAVCPALGTTSNSQLAHEQGVVKSLTCGVATRK